MRALLYTTLALLLLASVPWFFAEGSDTRIGGFPAWAVYSLAISIIYACVISVFVSRFWDNGDNDDESENENED